MMRVRILGSGTSSGVPIIGCDCAVCMSDDPRDTRLRTSGLVSALSSSILIDCGPDFRQQALRARITRLDAVLLTHAHSDHIGGIDELRAVNAAMRPKDADFDQAPPLTLFGCAQTLAEVKSRFAYIWDPNVQQGGGLPKLVLKEVQPFVPFSVGGVQIVPLPVLHGTLPILGYAIAVRGLVWITDASELPKETRSFLLAEETRPDVFVVNALRRKEHPTHWTIDTAAALCKQVKAPGGAYFVHLTHNEKHADIEQSLPGGVHVATDDLELAVRPASLS